MTNEMCTEMSSCTCSACVPLTGERSEVTEHYATRTGNGHSRSWGRTIGGKQYSFTAVLMPNGERRYAASRLDGPDARFACYWHRVGAWTVPGGASATVTRDTLVTATAWLAAHGINENEAGMMTHLAYIDRVSCTVNGVYVTFELNAGAGFECWQPGHGQTLKFRAGDIVTDTYCQRAEVQGYTSWATHTVALKNTDTGIKYSIHEDMLRIAR